MGNGSAAGVCYGTGGKEKEKEECLKLKEVAQNRCYIRTVKFALVHGPTR